METRLFLLLIIISVLHGCQGELPAKDLEIAITEIENYSGIDTIRFNDSSLVRKCVDDERVYLFREQNELGMLFKADEYLKIFPDKMKNIPRLNESDYLFGYGETRFSNSCITCHDPQKIDVQKWADIEKKEEPTTLFLNNSNYYFTKKNAFHWNFTLMEDYEKNALKEYIATVSKIR